MAGSNTSVAILLAKTAICSPSLLDCCTGYASTTWHRVEMVHEICGCILQLLGSLKQLKWAIEMGFEGVLALDFQIVFLQLLDEGSFEMTCSVGLWIEFKESRNFRAAPTLPSNMSLEKMRVISSGARCGLLVSFFWITSPSFHSSRNFPSFHISIRLRCSNNLV